MKTIIDKYFKNTVLPSMRMLDKSVDEKRLYKDYLNKLFGEGAITEEDLNTYEL